MKSNLLKYFTSIFLALFLLGNFTFAQTVTLDLGDEISGMINDEFTIQVKADLRGHSVGNFDFEFIYDPYLLEINIEDVTKGEQVTGSFLSNKPDPNRIKIGTYGNDLSGELILFEIKGTLIANGQNDSGVEVSEINIGDDLPTNISTPFNINVKVGDVSTNNETETAIPEAFELKQNYPNPFNPTTVIPYAIPEATQVTITVHNVLGEKVATLVNQRVSAGNHTLTFDAVNFTSGVYFSRITAGNFSYTRKMLLIK
jgi:hypothetical protein